MRLHVLPAAAVPEKFIRSWTALRLCEKSNGSTVPLRGRNLVDMPGWPMCKECDGTGRVEKKEAEAIARRSNKSASQTQEVPNCPDCKGDPAQAPWCKTCDGNGRVK